MDIRESCFFISIDTNNMIDKEIIRFNTEYFRPNNPIDIESKSIHHITEREVSSHPTFNESLCKENNLVNAIKENKTFVCHNAEFTIPIINRYLESSNLPLIEKYICTMNTSRYLHKMKNTTSIPEKYNLQYLRYFYELESKSYDTLNSFVYFRNLQGTYGLEGGTLKSACHFSPIEKNMTIMYLLKYFQETYNLELLAFLKMTQYMENPANFEMVYGKHKNKSLKAVYKEDPKYFDWAINNLEDELVVSKMVMYIESTI